MKKIVISATIQEEVQKWQKDVHTTVQAAAQAVQRKIFR